MTEKKIILSFFIFSILIISHIVQLVDYVNFYILFFVFWFSVMCFDLYTTFKRKELLVYEINVIMKFLLKNTTNTKSILLYMGIEFTVVLLISLVTFPKVDFVVSSIFGVFFGLNHIIAGVSNYTMIKKFDSNGLSL